jgi:electron transfer flavoprotein alpha subunit
MSMLVVLEHDGGAVSPGSLGVLTQAAALDADVATVLVGGDLDAVAAEAGRHGAATVFTVADAFASPLPGPRIDVLAELVRTRGYDTILFSNSVLAADVAAGLAARLDAGINWDLIDLELRDGQPVGLQPMLQDSVVAHVGWRSAHASRCSARGPSKPLLPPPGVHRRSSRRVSSSASTRPRRASSSRAVASTRARRSPTPT